MDLLTAMPLRMNGENMQMVEMEPPLQGKSGADVEVGVGSVLPLQGVCRSRRGLTMRCERWHEKDHAVLRSMTS
jgi:hypothetical protein